jgi:hypothetical protein
MDSLSGVRYGTAITGAARRHGVDPKLLAAVAAQETGGPGSDSGRNVVGDGGHGHGLFQIDDRWHAFARTAAAMDPAKNADYAAGMLSNLLKRFGGNVREALSAYNAGSPTATGTTTDWGDGKRVGYADSVLKHLARLDGDAPEVASLDAGDPAEASQERFPGRMSDLSALATPQPLHAATLRSWTRDAHINDQIAGDRSLADTLAASLLETSDTEGLL